MALVTITALVITQTGPHGSELTERGGRDRIIDFADQIEDEDDDYAGHFSLQTSANNMIILPYNGVHCRTGGWDTTLTDGRSTFQDATFTFI